AASGHARGLAGDPANLVDADSPFAPPAEAFTRQLEQNAAEDGRTIRRGDVHRAYPEAGVSYEALGVSPGEDQMPSRDSQTLLPKQSLRVRPRLTRQRAWHP